ncbi:DUF6716 putative glycosyltransferase [Aeromicrobium sp.]|uniref:DUF6716 putative glycosyltransferase n=1 Tax=Aeromicrobium sp. TaxID=1871063 RepID=UPI002FC638B5
MPTALLIASFDSQLKWCAGIRSELTSHGFECRTVTPDTRNALSPQQIADAGFGSIERMTWDELVTAARHSDVVVSALAGPATQRLTIDLSRELADIGGPGPVIVSGWVGIIIEKLTAGYLDRCGTDVVAVNSAHDLANFKDVAARLSIPDDNLVLAGLPFVSSSPRPARDGPIRTVLFADQPTVPRSFHERRHVYQRLIDYALVHPDREVLLKPRHRIGEDTFHTMLHHPEDVLAGVPTPPNFRIDYTAISQSLPHVDLLLTLSSTACLEAIDHGCRVALVLDLGVHERHGNHVFMDSGMLRTFDQIVNDEIGVPDPAWVRGYFSGREGNANQIIVDRVAKLLADDERPSRGVWASPYFRSTTQLSDVEDSYKPTWRAKAWGRRVRKHGVLIGTASHLANLWFPPVLVRAVQALRRR